MAWILRLLVRLVYPRDFRASFGDELVEAALHSAHHPPRGRAFGRRLWVVCDVVRGGVLWRLDTARPWGLPDLRPDLRFASRSLRSSTTFTLTTVSVLGFGMAACLLAVAASKAYLLTAAPLPGSDRIASVEYWTLPGGDGLDPWGAPVALRQTDWAVIDPIVDAALMASSQAFAVAGSGGAEWLDASRVNPGYFSILGRGPALGRYFEADADPHAAVISHRLWTAHFGGAPDVIGRTLDAYTAGALAPATALTIVGVLPADAWLPSSIPDVLLPLHGQRPPDVIRLRPGVTPQQAADRIAAAVAAQSPESIDGAWRPTVTPLRDLYRSNGGRLGVVGLAVTVLMLIALVNAATLVRVRAEARRAEFATRQALGAPPGRLRRHLVAESAVLVLLAGGLALVLADFASGPVAALVQDRLGGMPGGEGALRVGWTELGAALLGSLVVTGVLASVSVLTLRRRRIDGGRLRTRARSTRSHDVVVAAQAGLSVAVLVCGGLLAHSALELARVDMGYRPAGAFAVEIPFHSDAYSTPFEQSAFHDRFIEQLRADPGVRAATVMSRSVEFDVPTGMTVLDRDGVQTVHSAVVTPVGNGFFETLGIPVAEGRGISAFDDGGSQPVAVVGRRFAETAWPGRSPIGAEVLVGEDRVAHTVVGVVGDVREHRIRPDLPNVYTSYHRAPSSWSTVMLRSDLGFGEVNRRVRRIVRRLDPTLPIWELRPMSQRSEAPSQSIRFLAGLLASLALSSLALATWGVYGSVAYRVERTGPDLRIRMALGARPARVAAEVAGRTLRFAGVGMALGALAAAAGVHLLESQLFGVSAYDAGTYVAVVVVGLGVVATSAAVASRRALSIPLTTLDA